MHNVDGMIFTNTFLTNLLMDNPAEYFKNGRRISAHNASTPT